MPPPARRLAALPIPSYRQQVPHFTPAPSPVIELQTFGGVGLSRQGALLTGRDTHPRRLALLAVLAATGVRGVNRADIVTLLWPERETARARSSLAQWLFLLRQDLGASDLVVGGTVLRMNPDRVKADVWEFDDAMFRHDFATAARLYRGEFVEGLTLDDCPEFEQWAERERMRLRSDVIRALESNARAATARGDHISALGALQQLATVDPKNGKAAAGLADVRAALSERVPIGPVTDPLLRSEGNAPAEFDGAGSVGDRVNTPTHANTAIASSYLAIVRERLGGYANVLGEAGRTSVLAIFDGADRRSGLPLTIRVVLPDIAVRTGIPRLLELLTRAASLEHDCLAPLGEVAEVDGLVVCSTPRQPSTTLRALLETTPQLSLRDAVNFASSIAEALANGEQQRIAHLDLSPRRVLVTQGRALVTDLGVMQAVVLATSKSAIESGAVLGNPAYLSPEQLAGESEGDSRSDVFSLGCILYQMLAGEPPHGRGGGRMALVRRLRDTPLRIRDVRESVPAVLDDLLNSALARSPADRLPTMASFRDELRAIIQGEVV
jgi:DNA-binding SARP family transcriptional activator